MAKPGTLNCHSRTSLPSRRRACAHLRASGVLGGGGEEPRPLARARRRRAVTRRRRSAGSGSAAVRRSRAVEERVAGRLHSVTLTSRRARDGARLVEQGILRLPAVGAARPGDRAVSTTSTCPFQYQCRPVRSLSWTSRTRLDAERSARSGSRPRRRRGSFARPARTIRARTSGVRRPTRYQSWSSPGSGSSCTSTIRPSSSRATAGFWPVS